MNWGCLSFIILFPVGLIIWAKGEMRRRKAMPPAELEKLEAREQYGPINKNVTCPFCHAKDCIRTRKTIESIGSPALMLSKDNLKPLDVLHNPLEQLEWMARRELSRTAVFLNAHCMHCDNSWQMFPPEKMKS